MTIPNKYFESAFHCNACLSLVLCCILMSETLKTTLNDGDKLLVFILGGCCKLIFFKMVALVYHIFCMLVKNYQNTPLESKYLHIVNKVESLSAIL